MDRMATLTMPATAECEADEPADLSAVLTTPELVKRLVAVAID